MLKSFSFIRFLKSLHGWLGILIMPWIIVIGLTGFYLNHSKLVLSYFPSASYDEAQFKDWPNPFPMDEAAAKAVAEYVLAGSEFRKTSDTSYHGFDVHTFESDRGEVIVTQETGHYWVKSGFWRHTYDPDGRLLDRKYYWGSLFKALHTNGWYNSTLGTWLADITAGAMVLFGLSGIFLFLSPRLRRRANRKGRDAPLQVERSGVPRPQRIRLKS